MESDLSDHVHVIKLIRVRGSDVVLKKIGYQTCLITTTAAAKDRNYQEESLTHKEEMAPMAPSDSERFSFCGRTTSLLLYKKNESMLCDQIVVLKRDASFNELDINGLKKQVERLKKEKEDNQ
ncbi:hypothetical protein Tco_1109610 [Tanacetum coccineum]